MKNWGTEIGKKGKLGQGSIFKLSTTAGHLHSIPQGSWQEPYELRLRTVPQEGTKGSIYLLAPIKPCPHCAGMSTEQVPCVPYLCLRGIPEQEMRGQHILHYTSTKLVSHCVPA